MSPSPRPGAGVGWATLVAGALVAHHVAGRATRDALFLSEYEVRSLPAMMMAGSLLAVLAVLALARMLAQWSPARVLPLGLGTAAASLVGLWAMSRFSAQAVAVLVYLHMALFGATLISAFWSLMNERFDPYTARRVMSRIGLGASLGGVLGGLLAVAASRVVPVPAMLVVMALMVVLALLGLSRVIGDAPGPERARPGPASPFAGLTFLRSTPYLRNLALLVASGALVEALLDYVLGARAAAAYAQGSELMGFFALFHTGVSVAALVAQGLFARPALDRLGLAGTVALQPLAAWMGGMIGLLVPRLTAAVVVRGLIGTLHHSLFRSGYELFYTPVPEQAKRSTKAIVDVGFDKLGSIIGSALAFAAVLLAAEQAVPVLFGLAGIVGLLGLVVARRLHAGYVHTLARSLRSGAIRLDMPSIVDGTTRHTVFELTRPTPGAGLSLPGDSPESETQIVFSGDDPLVDAARGLRSSDPDVVRATLARHDPLDPALVTLALPALGRGEVFLDALRALRKAAPRATGQLVDALLDPRRPEVVRRRLPRVLKACPTRRSAEGLIHGLEDSVPSVRYECGAALLRLVERDPGLAPRQREAFEAVARELRNWPDEEAEAERERRIEHVFNLLGCVLDRRPLRIAHWALRTDDPLRGTALEYLDNVLPADLAARLFPLLDAATPRPSLRDHEALREALVREGDTAAMSRAFLRRRSKG